MQGLADTLFQHRPTKDRDAPLIWGPIPDPDVAQDWCIAMHHLISSVYGDGLRCGLWEPRWHSDNDDDFVEDEEKRRGLPRGALLPFNALPYMDGLTSVEYITGRKTHVEAILFGKSRETFGEWDSYLLFYLTGAGGPGANANSSLASGHRVIVGDAPWGIEVTLARILRTTKPVAGGKTQQCFYALLDTSEGFRYAAMQHVSCLPKLPFHNYWQSRADDLDQAAGWDEEAFFCGYPQVFFDGYPQPRYGYGKKLANFKASSISVVARAAADYINQLKQGGESSAAHDIGKRKRND